MAIEVRIKAFYHGIELAFKLLRNKGHPVALRLLVLMQITAARYTNRLGKPAAPANEGELPTREAEAYRYVRRHRPRAAF